MKKEYSLHCHFNGNPNDEIKDFIKDISKRAAKRIEIEEALTLFIKHYDLFISTYNKNEWTPEQIATAGYNSYFKKVIE